MMPHDDDDRELAALFARANAATRAPRGLHADVMARVVLSPRLAPLALPAPAPWSALLLRVATYPAVVLSCLLAGAVVAWPLLLARAGEDVTRAVDQGCTALAQAVLLRVPALHDPLVSALLLALACAPLLLLAWDAAHRAERWTVRLAGPPV